MEFNAVGTEKEKQVGPTLIKLKKTQHFRFPWLLGFVTHSDQKQGFHALDFLQLSTLWWHFPPPT